MTFDNLLTILIVITGILLIFRWGFNKKKGKKFAVINLIFGVLLILFGIFLILTFSFIKGLFPKGP